jgi:hypothetical protein
MIVFQSARSRFRPVSGRDPISGYRKLRDGCDGHPLLSGSKLPRSNSARAIGAVAAPPPTMFDPVRAQASLDRRWALPPIALRRALADAGLIQTF